MDLIFLNYFLVAFLIFVFQRKIDLKLPFFELAFHLFLKDPRYFHALYILN